MIDLEEFLRSIADNDGKNGISLFLFHTVMFAASAFVDISHIQNEGYASRNEARHTLFRRAKVLLDVGFEEDPLVTIQAILLMVHWNDIPRAEKDAVHWIGVSLSLAMSVGLHINPDPSTVTVSKQRVWRRTWWCVYNHCQLISEKLLSALHMHEDREGESGLEMPMIDLNDFEFHVYSPEAQSTVNECDILQNMEYQKMQAVFFIQKVKLCRLSSFSTISNRIKKMVRGEAIQDLEKYFTTGTVPHGADALQKWLFQLPDTAKPHYPLGLIPSEMKKSTYLHRAWLRLIYLGSIYATYCDGSHPMGEAFEELATSPSPHLPKQCLLDMMDLFDEIGSLGLSEQLPCLATPFAVLVLTFHRHLLENDMQSGKDVVSRSVHKCWNLIKQLQESSDLALRIIQAVENPTSGLWERLLPGQVSYKNQSQASINTP
ncbi:fungal-specific transcription factor domain-containing protein [Penicillium verhagenii]|uniref:fungal-specific transcription factor domain-containing protein n=1 Tax=Penicillium verhagenii TaxID=1562060 RepID=UPI00254581C5|nr:fungal-specific transcription factor domain-containing protein [Penicillium verhagenii]KAJ5921059.1 fungal-specific transcription factor domain-containing protein [Penicillium verhagenii]